MDGKILPPQHQVFINFRGVQLRHNFIGFLVSSLTLHGINVFIDTCEDKGEDISRLFKRIEDSRIAIVVFSSRYTESVWCLDELAKIKECLDLNKLKVLPIFYKIKTGEVKQLTSKFGEEFRVREWEYRSEKHRIDKWKAALEFISGKIGLTLDEKSYEIDFIELIVKEILKMLKDIPTTQTPSSQATQQSKNMVKPSMIKATTQPKDNTKSILNVTPYVQQGPGKNTSGGFGSGPYGSVESNSFSVPYPQCKCYLCLFSAPTNQSTRGSPLVQPWNKTVQFGPDTSLVPNQMSFKSSTSISGAQVSTSTSVWYPPGTTMTTTSHFGSSEIEDFPDYENEFWNRGMMYQWPPV